MFLLRYFIKLGESELITVSWSDFDIKCKRITLDDEQKPFSSSLPSTLYKSVTQIFVKGKKLITITIFYTTLNCLVQGSVTQKWVETEFNLLSETVADIFVQNKENNPDEIINKMTLVLPLQNEAEQNENIQNSDKKSRESDENDHTPTPETDKEGEIINEKQGTLCDDDILQAIHSIETDHIDQSITLQSDVKSIQIVANEMLKTLQCLCTKVEALEKKVYQDYNNVVDQRLKKIEEQISTENQNQTKSNDDNTHFIDTLVELTSQVSGLENKIDEMANISKIKQTNKDIQIEDRMKEPITHSEENMEKELQINVETYNKFEILQNFSEDNVNTESSHNLDGQQDDKNKSNPAMMQGHDHHKHINTDKYVHEESSQLDEKDTQFGQDTEQNTDMTVSNQKDKFLKHEVPVIDLWIVGTSITKNINPRLMYNNKVVQVTTLGDKTISGAKSFIESSNVKAKVILLQIGSNDLNRKNPNEALNEFEDLLHTCRDYIPTAEIVIGEILPRFQSNLHWRKTYEEKRREFNLGLKRMVEKYKCTLSRSPYISEHDVIDGIHITPESGLPKLVKSYKIAINKLLGLKEPTQQTRVGFHRNKNIGPTTRNYASRMPLRESRQQNHNYPFSREDNRNYQYSREVNRNYPYSRDENNYQHRKSENYTHDNNTYNDEDRLLHSEHEKIYPTPYLNTDENNIDYNHGYTREIGRTVYQTNDKNNMNKVEDQTQEKLKLFLKNFIQELC
ncbi:unnamed protein product [Mytilus edulis]|uniref:SGNH hydrolase-type esterase domain-containing protein n=1 Tax=Mytilus edulis TaxID=6550 RepID=A0A8S3UN04_MYTED|nr:unnamed protein product [Mytilus edulis]